MEIIQITEAMGIWRFAGEFPVVKRQVNAGAKLPEFTSASL